MTFATAAGILSVLAGLIVGAHALTVWFRGSGPRLRREAYEITVCVPSRDPFSRN